MNVSWSTTSCELCKAPFPLKIGNNKLFMNDEPKGPHMVLELDNRDGTSGVHIVSFVNECVARLGRGHDNDVRVSDISVSRLHATISYSNGNFTLEDNGSKFGSLLQCKAPVRIRPGHPVHAQIGRTVLSLSLGKQDVQDYFSSLSRPS